MESRLDSKCLQTSQKLASYNVLFEVGKGSFGRVYCIEKDNQQFALKKINKSLIIEKQIDPDYLINEKNIMKENRSPFVVRLYESFQDTVNAYIVMDYCAGGDLRKIISRFGFLSERETRFYTMQIVLGLKALHTQGVMYRDLKPENVLMTSEGHLKLGDFGLAKIGVDKTKTLCGTLLYMAPEVVRGSGYDFTVDFWGLGCVFFEMLQGESPFNYQNDELVKDKILRGEFAAFHPTVSKDARSLVAALLRPNPSDRLGRKGIGEIMAHPFFRKESWADIENFRVDPPIVPNVSNSTSNSFWKNGTLKRAEIPTTLTIPNFSESLDETIAPSAIAF